jgi:WD40 repeat protein
VIKCLEKDRGLRYQTANDLALDVERHIRHEPVLARPASKGYRLKKLIRRNKFAFSTSTVVFLLLLISSIISINEALRARLAEKEQARLRIASEIARRKEAELEKLARDEATRARAAEKEMREKLWGSYLAQAQAGRWSGRMGKRFHGLELIKKAADIKPSLELRNEAIACLALPDLRVATVLHSNPELEAHSPVDPLARYYALASTNSIRVFSMSENLELARLPALLDGAQAFMLFSPDATKLSAFYWTSTTNSLAIWDWKAQKILFRPSIKAGFNFAFSPDSQTLAVGDQGALVLHNMRSGELQRSIPLAHQTAGLAFHPDNRLIAVGNVAEWLVRVIDIQSGEISKTFVPPTTVLGLDWSSDGSLLVAGCSNGQIIIWDFASGEKIRTFTGHQSAVLTVRLSKDSRFLFSTSWDGTLRLWSIPTGSQICSDTIQGVSAQFTPDDWGILCLTPAGHIQILEFNQAPECRIVQIEQKAGTEYWQCSFSPSGHLLASGHTEGVRLWDLDSHRSLPFQPIGRTTSVHFISNGQELLTSGPSGIRKWALPLARENNWNLRPLGSVSDYNNLGPVDVIDDGQTILFMNGSTPTLIDSTVGKTEDFPGDSSFEFSAASYDRHWLAAGSWRDNFIHIYSVQSRHLVTNLPAIKVSSAKFSPDNRWLVAGGYEHYFCWDTKTWERVFEIRRESTSFNRAVFAFSPDSSSLAISFSSDIIKLLQSSTGLELAALETTTPRNISAIAFSPDATKLAVFRWDSFMELWDLARIRSQLSSMNLDW